MRQQTIIKKRLITIKDNLVLIFQKRTAMKKILLGFLALFLAGNIAVAQPVSDNAVIPMGITLNSILRLTVISGGNIEFVFNTVADYQAGLFGTAYKTSLQVESSSDWDLAILANDFTGSAGTFEPTVVDYSVSDNGGANTIVNSGAGAGATQYAGAALASNVDGTGGTYIQVTNTSTPILTALDGNDGVGSDNAFQLWWRCGHSTNILINNHTGVGATGRSSTSVLLTLSGS